MFGLGVFQLPAYIKTIAEDKAKSVADSAAEKEASKELTDRIRNYGDDAKKDEDDKDKDKDKEEDKFKLLPEGWNFHAQTTLIPSFDPGFGAKYSGARMAQHGGLVVSADTAHA